MPFGLSPLHLLVALIIGLVIIGPRKLPKLGSSAGRWIREFREGAVESKDAFVAEVSAPAPSPSADGRAPDASGDRTP